MALIRLNIPLVPRILLLSSLALTIVNFFAAAPAGDAKTTPPASTSSYLVIVPQQLLRHPWTLVTAAFVERGLFALAATCTGVFFGGKYLDRAWGSREFAQFVLVVVVASNAATALSYLAWSCLVADVMYVLNECFRLWSFCFASRKLTFGNRELFTFFRQYSIHGGIALVASFLVAFKQLIPEYTVTLFQGVVKMRIKHFPALFLLVTFLGSVLRGAFGGFYLGWLGFLLSWTYLRFFKVQYDLSTAATATTAATTLKGDASDIFAFACFFPDAVQPAVALATDNVHALLVRLRVLTPFSDHAISSSNEQVVARGHVGLPTLLRNADRRSGRTEEAERRRALAVKALNQRLERAAAERAAKRKTSGASTVGGGGGGGGGGAAGSGGGGGDSSQPTSSSSQSGPASTSATATATPHPANLVSGSSTSASNSNLNAPPPPPLPPQPVSEEKQKQEQ